MAPYFMDTVETVPDGVGISAFGPEHLLWLFVGLAAAGVLCTAVRAPVPRRRRRITGILTVLLLLDEAFKHTMLIVGGNWLLRYLPLHLCSINIFTILLHELRRSPLTEELLYATCLPAAVLALLFPTWTRLPALNFMSLHSFSVHILLALYPLVLLAAGELRPDPRRLKGVLGLYAVVLPLVYGFNKLFDTDFMFLNGAGSGNPLSLLEAYLGDPGYLIGLPVGIALIWAVLYGPLLLRRRRAAAKKERSSTAEG